MQTLVGVGSSICGGSAIAAAAPVIKASDKDIAQSISVIFLFNVVAAFLFPALGDMLALPIQALACGQERPLTIQQRSCRRANMGQRARQRYSLKLRNHC